MVISGYAATVKRLYASSTTWKREAISPDAVMIQDYEPHGGHNADWDAGWNGGTQIDTDADGNHYLTLNANLAAGSWFINCNHQSNGALAPTLNSFTGYVVKIDIKLANDIAYPDGAMYGSREAFAAMVQTDFSFIRQMAEEHHKPFALTETGSESMPDPEWWTKTLAPAVRGTGISYLLIWRNAWNKPKHYFSTFVGEHSAPDFVEFYKLPETIFAGDLK